MGCSDISRGTEVLPVACQNDRDEEEAPSGYTYIRELQHPEVPLILDAFGCDWDGVFGGGSGGHEAVAVECGPACACSLPECGNRASQRGLSANVKVIKTEKGWSAFAAEAISAGSFVSQYAGELLSTAETRQRLAEYDADQDGPGHALLVVREILPSLSHAVRINVDATRRGNVARFFNHRCGGGNLEPAVVRMNGKLVPHIAMVSLRDIAEGEELTFEYGSPNAGGKPHRLARRCLCGSPACLGYLPCDTVS